jgi:hypothetical protein
MAELNIFEIASKKKLRFESSKGMLTVEQLWDLPLQSSTGAPNLDAIGIALMKAAKAATETISLVDSSPVSADSDADVKLQIVKHVIDVRKAERDAANAAREKAALKQRIMGIMAKRKDEALDNTSDEALQKMLDAM